MSHIAVGAHLKPVAPGPEAPVIEMPGLCFEPLDGPSHFKSLVPLLDELRFVRVALLWGQACDEKKLMEQLHDGRLKIWRMLAASIKQPTFAVYSNYTCLEHVNVYGSKSVEPTIMCNGIWALATALFAQTPARTHVFCAQALPVSQSVENALLRMGFESVFNDLDLDVKQSYALERATFEAYRLDPEESL